MNEIDDATVGTLAAVFDWRVDAMRRVWGSYQGVSCQILGIDDGFATVLIEGRACTNTVRLTTLGPA